MNSHQRRKAARNTRPSEELVAKLLLMDAFLSKGHILSHIYAMQLHTTQGEPIHDVRDRREYRIVDINRYDGAITTYYPHIIKQVLATVGLESARYCLLTNALRSKLR